MAYDVAGMIRRLLVGGGADRVAIASPIALSAAAV